MESRRRVVRTAVVGARKSEEGMRRRRGEKFAPTRDLVSRAKDWTAIVSAVVITVTVLTVITSYSSRVLDSGPMPFPSRTEVTSVASALLELHNKDDKLHQDQIDQLKQLADRQQIFADQQKRSEQERMANRLSALQSAIDTAKAIYDKDPSTANEKIMEALQQQLMDLRRQMMDSSPPASSK